MQAPPNTTVTILRAESVDSFSGQRVNEAAVNTGVLAFIIERPATRPRTGSEGRAVEDPATDHPRLVRVISGRLPADTAVVQQTDRLQDESTGRIYGIRSIRRHGGLTVAADLILELTAVDAVDP